MKQEFLGMLEGAETICILGHTNPDGDCLGATLGLYNYIRRNYPEKEASVYLMEASRKFSYLPGFDEILHRPSERKYQLAFILDCAGPERLGDFHILAENAEEVYVVDHHKTSLSSPFSHRTILPDASSSCELLYELLDKEKLDRGIASCLYTGIIHDTGVFKYSATSPRTMEIAGKLMSYGIDFSNIIDDSFYLRSYAQQQVRARVLMESVLLLGGRVIAGVLRRKEMRFYGVNQKEIDGIVSDLRETRGMDGAVFLYEVADRVFKVSLRSSRSWLDVSEICAFFGGGGHKMAAGCCLPGEPEEILEKLSREIKKQLPEGERSRD